MFPAERLDPQLGVEASAGPAVLVLRAIRHEHENRSHRDAIGNLVEQLSSLGIRPMRILEHQQQGLPSTFPNYKSFDRREDLAAPLGRLEDAPFRVLDRDVEKIQE